MDLEIYIYLCLCYIPMHSSVLVVVMHKQLVVSFILYYVYVESHTSQLFSSNGALNTDI